MKSKDLQVIFMVAVVSLVASILLSGRLFSSEEDRSQSVETAEPITTQFIETDSRYFNDQSFNPAKIIEIGRDPASNPFRGN